jgi:Ca2+:H+ antiporter
MARWPLFIPLFSAAVLGGAVMMSVGPVMVALCSVALIGTVFAAVHHAEVVAHRVGEPLGTLVLAVAVTVIEASLILALMFADAEKGSVIARDTLYAAVMIICNGVIGVCVLAGSLAHREQSFRVEGAGAALSALIALSVLALVLPDFTVTTSVGTYSGAQLAFAAVASFLLWAVFVFIQTVRHRDYFLPTHDTADQTVHADPPSIGAAWASFGLLVVSLIVVVGLAKVLSVPMEKGLAFIGAPPAVIGIVIALIVLMPETFAAVRAARANRLQTSMNLALGSALASIGLTIPVVAVAALVFDLPLVLGLAPKDVVMLALTLVVSVVTLGTGRTHVMQGAVQLVIFAAYLFLALVP